MAPRYVPIATSNQRLVSNFLNFPVKLESEPQPTYVVTTDKGIKRLFSSNMDKPATKALSISMIVDLDVSNTCLKYECWGFSPHLSLGGLSGLVNVLWVIFER